MAVLAIPLDPFVDVAPLHLVMDSALGIVSGVAFVAAYLAALRWLDGQRSGAGRDGVTRSPNDQGQEPE